MMKLFIILIAAILSSQMGVYAADIASFEKTAKADLKKSSQKLATLRQKITQAKIPLAKKIRIRENKLQSLRRQVRKIQQLQDSRTVGIEELRRTLKGWRDENIYLANLLSEYQRNLTQSLNKSEDHQGLLTEGAGGLRENFKLLNFGLARLRNNIGGHVFEGKAIAENGDILGGSFVHLGPLLYFKSRQGNKAGVITQDSGGTYAHFIESSDQESQEIGKLLAGKLATLNLDVTGGKATAITTTNDGILDHVSKGGIWIFPILTFALLSLITALFKAVQIYRVKLPEARVLHQIIDQVRSGQRAKAHQLAAAQPAPVNEMLVKAVEHADRDKEYVEEIMYETLLETQPKLERFLPLIAITAATAPLLGLLGTVTGMIHTFKLITLFGTGDAKSLSSGISEALITTEFGLVVAIPALILHALLSRKCQAILATMEKYAVIFSNGIGAIPTVPPKEPARQAPVSDKRREVA